MCTVDFGGAIQGLTVTHAPHTLPTPPPTLRASSKIRWVKFLQLDWHLAEALSHLCPVDIVHPF